MYIGSHGWNRTLCGDMCAVISMFTKACGVAKEQFPKGKICFYHRGRDARSQKQYMFTTDDEVKRTGEHKLFCKVIKVIKR